MKIKMNESLPKLKEIFFFFFFFISFKIMETREMVNRHWSQKILLGVARGDTDDHRPSSSEI